MIRYKTYTSAEDTAPTNNGGFLGGLGYVGQKIGAGFMQTFEGVWDYTAGGIADIFGADEWAKRQMDEDWFGTWYSDIDKNFNPGKGWKIAGDVAGGIGNVGAGVASAVLAVGAATGITLATGGTGLPVAASTIATTAGALTAGFGAAGNATKEAYRETGELTGKEYGYGALSGATEAGLELVTAGIGKGSGKLLKSVGKAVAGEASEEAAKVGAKAIIKEVAKDFASEAFEEGASEYLAPKYKRMTYDPNAQDATREEIAYAAFIGGLTGAVMNGANGAVTLTSDAVSGKKAKASGQAELIEKLGKQISEEEAKSPSGYELLANIKKIYNRGGDSAVRVGQLKRMEAAARLLPAVEKSAMAIVSAPQYAVERFARMGVTEINGKALSAEMLTEAIDLDHGNKAALKTLRQAISKNPILATLAMADATAKLQLDSTKYTEGIASEGALGTSGDWNTFLATASAEEKAAVGKMFGVENIDALDYGTARAYAQAYAESDEGKATVRRAVRAKDAVEAIAENDKPLPNVIVTTDGARRYSEVGIIKEGGEVRFYDYTTGRMTQPMTVREANAKLAQDRAAALSETATETKTETKTEAKKPTADEEIHTWAMENIKKYNELTGRERQEVRATIRQARALGISEADTITYATVAARSGVRIVFSKEQCLRHVIVEEDGKLVEKVGFSDGFYNHNTNEIVVNPEGKRSPTKVLLHELAHALYANKGFARLLDRAAKRMDDDRKKEITDRYTKAGQEEFIPEEHAVHHAEDVVGNDATLERLLRDEPTMGDKILSFFGLAKTDYQGHERLSRAAGRLYNRYKATFDRFATANRGTVRIEGIGDSKGIRDAETPDETTESTMAIRHAEDGAVVKSPVTEMVISTFKGGVRDSITTEFVALPKQEMSVTTGEGQIQHEIEGIEATPVKGIGGQTIAGFTGREVREWAMGLNGFTAEQIENVNRFMDEMGKFMKKAGVTYRFIGLTDVENAKLHYTYDAQGNIKSIVLSAMVKNGDYPVNFDLSSICKKRVAMSTLIDKLANRGTLDNGTVALTPAQIFAINTALKNAGYETACLGCFVESKRYNAMAWAKSFVSKWNAAVKAVNPNATYFGYGDGTNTTEVTVAQANRIDVATKEYIAKTKTKRMEQALSKYKEKAAKGLPLISGKKQMVNGKEIETFTKAARDRIVRSETISDALKDRYLNSDVSTLGMDDVEFLLENGVLPGASISNKQAVTELVKSGEAYQHLLRPSDLLTAKGIAKLEELPNFHGVLYGHYGSGTPKLMQSFTPYNSEIALLPSKKGDTGLAEYLYSIAGVRMQSFSDFQVQNIYDYLQMVADLAARKLPAHAYTKEISFARLLGMTGIKVNLSVMFDIDPTVDAAHAGLTRRIPFIHKGEYANVVLHDEQGDWVYNIGDYQTQRAFHEAYPDADLRFLQSIGFADAVKLQTTEGYSANCGIIGVGYSDLHILAMLDDNRIRYVIPYHASSLPAEIKVATNIALGTDYTPYQNTMKIDSIVDKNGKTVEWSVKEAYRRLGSGKAVLDELNAKIKSEGWVVKTKKAQNGHGTFGLYEDLGKTSDPRKTAENFMDWCAGNGSLPLFYQFASHANYYKLLYDYNVYDCVSEQYAPQTAVTNTYPAGDAAKPTNAADTRFDTTYLTGVIDKQMSFMDRYSQNLDRDLDVIASKVERGDMSGRRDALPERIAVGMDDADRAKILRKKKIVAPVYEGQADVSIEREIANLEHRKIGVVKATLERMAEEFGIIGKEIRIEDVDVSVIPSKSNIGESLSKHATPEQMAKLLPILREAVSAAIGIEVHRNRYYHDTDTTYFENLVGGFVDGQNFVPVRFGLKHSITGRATLYVVVDQDAIPITEIEKTKKTEVLTTAGMQGASPTAARSVAYSISEIVPLVNSKDLLRYFPDDMLSPAQRKTKWEAIAEAVERTDKKNDERYIGFLSRGNIRAAKEMVLAAAKAAGYTHVGYHGTHAKPFTVFERGIAGIYLATNRKLAEDFATGFRGEVGTLYNLVAKIKKPFVVEEHINSAVPYYYNIPTPTAMRDAGYSQSTVSTEEIAHFAEDNGYDGVIIKGIREGAGVYTDDIIVFDSNQVKSADPVTYDDDGKVIPLSKRFDMENPDIRYALPEDATYVSPTAGAVGKTKAEYKADFRDNVFTAKTRTYIDTVDELYGIETYLRKVGKMDKAAVEALVQQARAARSQAQTMIGTAQYNVFSDKVERMGDGLLEILKPAQKWTEEKRIAFDDYLLHQLNIDRMTLESRSFVWAAPLRRTVQTTENALAALENRKKQLTSDIGKKQTALNNAKVRRGVVKTAKAKEVWNKQVDTFARELSALNDLLKEAKRDIAKKKKELGKAKEEYEAALLKNKPVFGKDETLDEDGNMKRDHDITADESRDIVKKYDAAHPEFANLAKRLYAYLDNVQKLRVEAGIITQDMADRMKQLYPHYVPSYRDVEGGGISSIKGKNAMEVSKTVRKAKGGNQDILDVSVSIAMQTDEVLKAGQINKLARALYDAAKASGDDTYVKILSEEAVGSEEDAVDAVMRPKPGQLTFYADGKRVTLEISKELLSGFDGLRKPSVDFESPVMQALAFLNTWFKRGVTSMNPAFAIRNPIRDFQDAGLNSKHPVLFARYMMTVGKEMLQNSADWELYRAMGGFSSTVFDGSLKDKAGRSGFEALVKVFGTDGEVNFMEVAKRAKNLLKNVLTTIENINAFLEQTTRFAEFKASLAAGDSPAVALNNSAEVTTNFGRRGKITKTLNATVMPFLNPAIQGFDKIFRNVGDAFTGGHWVRGMAWLITKAAVIGIAPMLLNSLMYDDDEEYEKLRETDKENNFLIKTADGTFIKIPRGRLASVIGGLYNRGNKIAKGEDAELSDYASNVVSQITPVENVSRTIFSPIFDVKNNKTWYGGEIEGREWDDTAPRDRYDESTSSIAVWIGQAINYSPKKVHYLLDQYSGVIGDFALPATSKKEKRDFFSGNFTLDSVTSNKLSERFYDAYDKTAYADTAGDEAATYRLKYLNDVKKAVRGMNKELDEIRNSDLSNIEKLQKTRVVRSLINAAYDSALKSLDAVNAAIEETAGIEDEVLREAEVNRRVFGAEYALKQYSEKTYEKYMLMHGGGIGYDELYAYHFATLGIESDLDKRGNVIEGSKKKKILAVINSLNIPKEQKLILLYSRGYSAKDGDIKGVSAARAKTVLAAYIAKAKGLTKAQREELAKACGLKVTNGRISVK